MSTTTIETTVFLHLDPTETADLIPALRNRQTSTHGGLDVILGTLPDGRNVALIVDPLTGGSILVATTAPIPLPAG